MRILIVEDEITIANRLIRLLNQSEELSDVTIKHFTTLDDADDYIDDHVIDILFLDLNLNNKDGFQLLKKTTAKSFHTIVVSANVHRAIEAFEFGVLDFIPKPFTLRRIEQALNRIGNKNHLNNTATLKYLTVRHLGELEMIKLDDIAYIKAASNYSEIVLMEGATRIHNKSLNKLIDLLPESFHRVHRSYLVPVNRIVKLMTSGNGNYTLLLTDDTELPVSRSKIKELKKYS